MLVTEEEAREIECRRLRVDGHADVVLCSMCIATKCMHWRWWDRATKTEVVVPARETGGDPVTREVPTTNRRGYCGLSGIPAIY